ncbi:uncharacterized protein LOC123305630 [Chrysoperla carnea]|uniref:uncharacterized protein LOC123305630 n=1 Tax=Chrysoperla carnea TaxID=189513 RepID=UPI001D07A75A|nr:uncharacterized protein LOC123305630 [Chrysoperla carnea]
MACMHAYGFKKVLSNELMDLSDKISQSEKFDSWFNKCIDLLSKIIDLKHNKKVFSESFTQCIESFYKLLASEKFPKTLCHANFGRDHLMFQYDNDHNPIRCCLLNFQTVSFLSPVFDLFIFLYGNTTSQFRENHLLELTRYYYNELSTKLEKHQLKANDILTKIDFETICVDMVIIGRVISWIRKILETMNENEKFSASQNIFDFINSNSNEKVLQEIKHSEYEPVLIQILKEVEELLEYRNIGKEVCFNVAKQKLKSEISVKKISVDLPSSRTGYMGAHKFLNIHVQCDSKPINLKYFLKFVPEEQGQLNFLEFASGFKREVLIYKEIFETMKKLGVGIYSIVPVCHVVSHNFLLLDFLDEYRNRSKYEMFDFQHLNVMLRSLAKLHASSVIWEEKLSKQEGKPFLLGEKYNEILREVVYSNRAITDGMVDSILIVNDHLLKMIDSNVLKEKLMKIFDKVLDYLTASSKYRNVLNHSDLWSSNMMFKYNTNNEPIHCKLIDYQFCRYLPQSHDVLMSLYLTTSTETCEKYKLELLRNYHSYFKEELEEHDIDCDNIITFEEFLDSCEEMKPFSMIQKATFYHFIMQMPEYEKEFLASVELQDMFFKRGDRYDIITRNCEYEQYRELMRDSHVPLIEYLKTL